MKAREIMTRDHIWVCSETATAKEAAELMLERNVGFIPVVDMDGLLEGVVTDRDICCRLVALGHSYNTPVREIMSESLYYIDSEASLEQIEQLMSEHKIRRLPVVDHSRHLQGVISLGDLSKHCHGLLKEHHLAETLEAVSSG